MEILKQISKGFTRNTSYCPNGGNPLGSPYICLTCTSTRGIPDLLCICLQISIIFPFRCLMIIPVPGQVKLSVGKKVGLYTSGPRLFFRFPRSGCTDLASDFFSPTFFVLRKGGSGILAFCVFGVCWMFAKNQ